MACFLAPVAEAIVVSVIKKNMEKKEKAAMSANLASGVSANITDTDYDSKKSSIPFSRKLGWLTKLLWGGSFLLAIEHIWHGEVVPWPPFLTAMNNPADIGPMLTEIATVGVSMAVLLTLVWLVMILVSNRLERKAKKPVVAKATEG
ncbi:MAG: hypothetical protein R2876_02540 [Eubacteriales bacterium]